MNCIFCGKIKIKLVAKKTRDSSYGVVQCQFCGLIQLSPTPTPEEDRIYYDRGLHVLTIKEPTSLKILRKKQAFDTIRHADLVASLAKKGSRLLDIGSGFGFFLEETSRRGFKPVGIEISGFSRRIAKRVTKAPMLDIDLTKELPPGHFDVITLFHVLEHIADPVGFLKYLRPLLNSGSKIVLEVPNADDLMLKSCKAYRDFYWQRPHISYFTPVTLAKVFKKAGIKKYKLIFQQRYGFPNALSWLTTGKPQMIEPTYHIKGSHSWVDDFYKKYLTAKKISDTIVAIILV